MTFPSSHTSHIDRGHNFYYFYTIRENQTYSVFKCGGLTMYLRQGPITNAETFHHQLIYVCSCNGNYKYVPDISHMHSTTSVSLDHAGMSCPLVSLAPPTQFQSGTGSGPAHSAETLICDSGLKAVPPP